MKNRSYEFIRNPKKSLFTLAIPIAVGMLVQSLYNIVDTAWIGRLGAESIAALTFAFPVFFVLMSINISIATGMNSLVSRFIGARKKHTAENAAWHGVVMSIAASIIALLTGVWLLEPFFSILGATGNVLRQSVDYMSIILYGLPFMFISVVFSSVFSAEGDTRTPMIIQISGLLLNAILDPIFIYVLGYGVPGAAIATVISFLFSMALSIYFLWKKSYLRLRWKDFTPNLQTAWDIARIGAPAALTMLVMSIYFMYSNWLIASFGTEYIAAFGITSRLESIIILPTFAFSMATLTLVAMFFGARKHELIRSTIAYSIKVSVQFTAAIGILLFIFPSTLLKIFTDDAHLISLASDYLRVNVFVFPLVAVTVIIIRALQGLGLGFPGLVINGIRVFFVSMPLAYAAVFLMGYSFVSVAYCIIIGSMASSVVAVIWLEHALARIDGKRHT
jgi:putative MATE family efflux protein